MAIRVHTPKLVSLAILGALFALCTNSSNSAINNKLADQFSFQKIKLQDWPESPHQTIRPVHPSLKKLSAWMSALGASVAIADIDGDGLENDICHIDPRTDLVTIQPALPNDNRYQPFKLPLAKIGYVPGPMAPSGCLIGDVNEDGKRDVIVYFWGRSPVIFIQKPTDNSSPSGNTALSSDCFEAYNLTKPQDRWYTNSAVLSDLDGDGHCDLTFANYFPDGARILDASAKGQEKLHDTKARSYNGGAKHIFLWSNALKQQGSAIAYKEVNGIFPNNIDKAWTLATGVADLDGDLLPELYFANDLGPDRLLKNESSPGHLKFTLIEGKRGFFTPASFALGKDSFKGMGVDFADLNQDGHPDIYVSNITAPFGLHESNMVWLSTSDYAEVWKRGEAPYTQSSEKLGLSRSGWSWDCRMADFNNDGILEVVQATGFIQGKINRWPELQSIATINSNLLDNPRNWPGFGPKDDVSGQDRNPFFVQDAKGYYHDIGKNIGLDEAMLSRGIAVADVNGDGKLDMSIANQFRDSYLFLNDAKESGKSLSLYIVRPLQETNPEALTASPGHPQINAAYLDAIGTAVTLVGKDQKRVIAQVDGGSGHSGKRGKLVHFGLGNGLPSAEHQLKIDWRDRAGHLHTKNLNLKPGIYTLTLG